MAYSFPGNVDKVVGVYSSAQLLEQFGEGFSVFFTFLTYFDKPGTLELQPQLRSVLIHPHSEKNDVGFHVGYGFGISCYKTADTKNHIWIQIQKLQYFIRFRSWCPDFLKT